jgi:hypothetical protein
MLLTGSGDEFCGPLPALFQAVAYHLPGVSPSAFPAICLLKVCLEISSLFLPLLQCAYSTPPPLLCVSFSSLFFFVLFCFVCRAGRSVCTGLYAGLSQGWLVKCCMMLGAHLLVCWMSPKQVWSRHLVTREPSSFLSVAWCGEVLYGLGVQCVKVLILFGALFLTRVAPVSQQDFWFTELMLSASAP